MIFYDFEVFRYDWLVCYLDTDTKKMACIENDIDGLKKFYQENNHKIFVGYNSRGYDQWVFKAILAGFDPYKITDWIINKDRKGYEFSRTLNQFPLLNYDAIFGFRSLKELEAFMGDDIRETSVPFDINRKLTRAELDVTKKYCEHDVWETFKVFIETKTEFESHIGLVEEFNLPLTMINKTKAQLSAVILGANQIKRNDEFEISFPDTLRLGKYEHIKDHYENWAENIKDYDQIGFTTKVAGVDHVFGIGGIHGSRDNYMGDGDYILADVGSYYPALMIEYNLLSRNVSNPKKFKQIRDERMILKANKDPREYPRKIVLNSTYGAMKDQYNALYDPLQANNVCIYGQLLLVDLIDKIEHLVDIIQSNTDGVLFKLRRPEDREQVVRLCNEWATRTRMTLEFEDYKRIIQSNVNNYIMVMKDGRIKRKGAFVKKLNLLDNDLPIVNKAVVNYFVYGITIHETIAQATELIDFQKITKVSSKYEYSVYNNTVLHEKVYRVFATSGKGATLYKKHKGKDKPDKTAGTPENCLIINDDINGRKVENWVDKSWYIDLATKRVNSFLGV